MEVLTILIAIIVFFLVIGIIFHLIKLTLKIASIITLAIVCIVILLSIFSAHAYILPHATPGYLIYFQSDNTKGNQYIGIVSNQNNASQYTPFLINDEKNLAIKQWPSQKAMLQNITAQKDFDVADTVWYITIAQSATKCTSAHAKEDTAACLESCTPSRN